MAQILIFLITTFSQAEIMNLPACPASVTVMSDGRRIGSDQLCPKQNSPHVNHCKNIPEADRTLARGRIKSLSERMELWDEEIAFKLKTRYPRVLKILQTSGFLDYYAVKGNSGPTPPRWQQIVLNGKVVRDLVAMSMFDAVFRKTVLSPQSVFNPAVKATLRKAPILGREAIMLTYTGLRMFSGWIAIELFTSGSVRAHDELVQVVEREPLHLAYMSQDIYNSVCGLINIENTYQRLEKTLEKEYTATLWWHIEKLIKEIRTEECTSKYPGERIPQGRADPYCSDIMQFMKAPSEQRNPIR